MIVEDFLSEVEQKDIIDKINENEWVPITKSSNSREVQHYGYLYDYNSYKVTPTTSIPFFLKKLNKKIYNYLLEVKEENELSKYNIEDEDFEFDQIIINKYESKQSISAHIDQPKLFGKIICSISLGYEDTMIFKKEEKEEKIKLPIGSLVIIYGDFRYNWTHEIKSKVRQTPRISITFRKVNK